MDFMTISFSNFHKQNLFKCIKKRSITIGLSDIILISFSRPIGLSQLIYIKDDAIVQTVNFLVRKSYAEKYSNSSSSSSTSSNSNAVTVTGSSSHSSFFSFSGRLRKPSSKRKLGEELSRNNARQVLVAEVAPQKKQKNKRKKSEI